MSVDLETQLRNYREKFNTEAPPVVPEGRIDQPVVARETRLLSLRGLKFRPGLVVATAAVLMVLIVIGGVGLITRPIATDLGPTDPNPTGLPDNGWVAFTDEGIWLVALDQGPRRIVGTDTDLVDEQCPAFSPDGRRLAYARLEGESAALGVVDVDGDGRVSNSVIIELGDGLPPPCPVWSPDAKRVAFGVARTSPINPTTGAAGSEVWIVTLGDNRITVLPDLLATDLEWSPDGSQLAVASGVEQVVRGNMLHDGRIYLYEPASGTMRSIDATLGATELSWSPDGRWIAYERLAAPGINDTKVEIRVIDLDTGQQNLLDTFHRVHGIGPVWSPDGRWIAYQRCEGFVSYCVSEAHEVVLVPHGDPQEGTERVGEIVIHASLESAGGSACYLRPRSVTWSPDGRYLLYSAWGRQGSGRPSGVTGRCPSWTFLAAVPIADDQAAVKLTNPDIPSGRGGSSATYDDRVLVVPIQRWGARTAG